MSLAPPPGSQGPGPIAGAVVKAMELSLARRASGVLPGDHVGPGVGVGLELAQLRPYQPGDDVRRLDAAAEARTGEPHVRLEVPERLLTTWVVLDRSPSMAFGTADRLKSDVAHGAVEVLARVATRRGGRVGMVEAGVPHARALPPRSGRLARVALERAAAAGTVADGAGGPGLRAALGKVGRLARRPGLVAVISDFRDEDGWERELARLGALHSLVCAEIEDPREGALPDVGRVELADPETGRRVEADTADPRLRAAYAAAEAERRARVAAGIRRAGARHAIVSTAGDWPRQLARVLA